MYIAQVFELNYIQPSLRISAFVLRATANINRKYNHSKRVLRQTVNSSRFSKSLKSSHVSVNSHNRPL